MIIVFIFGKFGERENARHLLALPERKFHIRSYQEKQRDWPDEASATGVNGDQP
ncbi:hypothetical protein BSBH6_00874 [Bacillus subtilis]|nr:hypothetical protein BSBH6_00874 [Bacillus subtilis]RPK27235.1 hypothetical protein BH5_00871 [Bacillus subtilis]